MARRDSDPKLIGLPDTDRNSALRIGIYKKYLRICNNGDNYTVLYSTWVCWRNAEQKYPTVPGLLKGP
jgi:hypothetical protein